MAITGDMTIGSVVQDHPETVEVFNKYGMGCLSCPATAFENIGQGAVMHGIDVEQLLLDLNKATAA